MVCRQFFESFIQGIIGMDHQYLLVHGLPYTTLALLSTWNMLNIGSRQHTLKHSPFRENWCPTQIVLSEQHCSLCQRLFLSQLHRNRNHGLSNSESAC